MAVGAQLTDIVRLIFREGFRPVVMGVAAGVALGLVFLPLLDHLLFGVTPGSAQNYAFITTAIFVLSGVAMVLPALRAIAIEPATALIAE